MSPENPSPDSSDSSILSPLAFPVTRSPSIGHLKPAGDLLARPAIAFAGSLLAMIVVAVLAEYRGEPGPSPSRDLEPLELPTPLPNGWKIVIRDSQAGGPA